MIVSHQNAERDRIGRAGWKSLGLVNKVLNSVGGKRWLAQRQGIGRARHKAQAGGRDPLAVSGSAPKGDLQREMLIGFVCVIRGIHVADANPSEGRVRLSGLQQLMGAADTCNRRWIIDRERCNRCRGIG